jgi:hypothetical protein
MAALALGVILGGVIGYIGYAPIVAWRALRQACRQAFIDEKEERFTAIAVLAIILAYLICVFTPFYVAMCLFSRSGFFSEIAWDTNLVQALMLLLGYLFAGVLGFMIFCLFEKYLRLSSWVIDGLEDLSYEQCWLLLMLNPLSVGAIMIPIVIPLIGALFTVELAVVGLVQLALGLPRVVRIFWMTVLPQTIVAIHSEARLVVGIAAALGAATGFFAGSALTGALVGGVLGLTDVAFLRKRLLAWGASRAVA